MSVKRRVPCFILEWRLRSPLARNPPPRQVIGYQRKFWCSLYFVNIRFSNYTPESEDNNPFSAPEKEPKKAAIIITSKDSRYYKVVCEIVSNSAGSCVNNGLEAQQAAHLSGGGQMATVIYMNENRVEKTAMKFAVPEK